MCTGGAHARKRILMAKDPEASKERKEVKQGLGMVPYSLCFPFWFVQEIKIR